jgi:hypothetical protein
MDFGEWERNKTVSNVWMKSSGNDADSLSVMVGAQDYPGDSVAWEAAAVVPVNHPLQIDCFTDGRLIAFSVSSNGGGQWRVASMKVGARLSGRAPVA